MDFPQSSPGVGGGVEEKSWVLFFQIGLMRLRYSIGHTPCTLLPASHLPLRPVHATLGKYIMLPLP